MTNDEGRANDENRKAMTRAWFRHSGFGIVSTFVIRNSSFRERWLVDEFARQDRALRGRSVLGFRHSCFVIVLTFVIRNSSFH
jgi:hypothetical protein